MNSGYYKSPGPCEDGAPTRKFTAQTDGTGSAIDPREPLGVVESEVFSTTMTLWRDPGEVFVLGHSLGTETIEWVGQIDPETLEPIHGSPNLEAGPFWPGGIAAHVNGDLYGAHVCGNSLYLVGTSTVYRYHWDAVRHALELDPSWKVIYRTDSGQSYGRDPVLADGFLWFMENGAHNYPSTMRGAGVAPGPVHLICASLDSGEAVVEEVSGNPIGAITNPPLVDTGRKIAIAYDSANGYLTAWRYTIPSDPSRSCELSRHFQIELDTACHLLLYADQGVLVASDRGDGIDSIVFIEIETGEEISRAATTSPAQSVLILSPGWDQDLYYCSFARLVRVFNLGDRYDRKRL